LLAIFVKAHTQKPSDGRRKEFKMRSRVGRIEDQGKNYAKLLETLGKEINILSQNPGKLKDGTPSQEFTIGWKYNGVMPFLGLVVAVQKNNKIISFGGHVMSGDLIPMREIVQTLEFK
jgi:hypothetical protein